MLLVEWKCKWEIKGLTERAGPSLMMSWRGAVCELSRFGNEP